MLQIYTLGVLAAGILNTFVGFIVYSRNRKSLPNILFGLITLFFAIWCYSWVALLLVKTDGNLLVFFARLLNFGAVFLPFFYFHWIISILELEKKEKKSIVAGYVIAFIFAILSWTDWYVKGVHSILFFPNWPTAGPLYKWYLILGYSPFVLYTAYLLYKYAKTAQESNRKNQLKYVFLVTVLGFGAGALNFPLMYEINPFGPLGEFGMFVGLGFFIPFPILLSYSIVKYRFMDISVILTEVLAGFAAIILFIDILLSFPLLPLAILKTAILLIFIYLGIKLIKSVSKEVEQREKIEDLSFRIKKAYVIEKEARQQTEKAYEIEKRAGIAKERALELEKKALEKEKEVHKELERLDKAKNQFMLATQHHLRTPLTSMRGYLDLIFGGTYGKIPPKLKEVLKKFEISTKNEVKLINEFLDVSQFQIGKGVVILRDGVEVQKIVQEAVNDVEIEAKSKGIYVKAEIPKDIPVIKADEFKLKAAVYNIVDNAVKYTKQGGVTISLKKEKENLRIIIKDTGVGISKEEIGKLFGKLFERGDHAEKMFSTGRGIGLYITFKIVEAHNGRIWAESDGEGKGSAFIIELPITQAITE